MTLRTVAGVLAAAAISLLPIQGQQSAPPDDLQAIRSELESLRKAQEQMQKDLQEIKTLLRTRPQGPARPAPADIKVSLEGEPIRGSENASVVLIEYSDYQCPFCARFVRDTMPQIDAEYVKTGRIRHAFKDLPIESIHPNAFRAAVAAECAREQGRFWEMHDKLFENGKQLGADQLPSYAEAVGADPARFRQCLDSGKFDAEIRADLAEARASSIGSTPAFLVATVDAAGKVTVARTIFGAQPFAAFKSAIDDVLAGRK